MKKNSMKSFFLGSLRSKQTVVGILSLVLFVAVISFVVFETTKDSVEIFADGEKILEVSTHSKTVKELFEKENLIVSEYDKISPSLDSEIVDGMTIEWKQAKEVTISVDGKNTSIWTTEKLVKNILKEANIEVSEHDNVSLSLDAEVGADYKIDIQKAFQVTLVDGLKERQVWSTSTTVANFLKQQKIQVGELDRVNKKMEEVIAPNDKVAVVRVEKVTDVVEESIAFATEKKKDSSILKGTEKVVQAGKEGKKSRTFEVVKENGKEVSRTLVSEKVVEKPLNKVVAVGTKVVTASVSRGNSGSNAASAAASRGNSSSSAAPAGGGKEFYVTATAYTASCGGCSGITATGINLKANPGLKVIAVDPRVIPLGSKVWVQGYGYAIAGDTGGAIKGNKIDVFVPSESQARAWGRRTVLIKVLN